MVLNAPVDDCTFSRAASSCHRVSARVRRSSHQISIFLATFLALGVTLLWSENAWAQLSNFRTPPLILPDVESTEQEAENLPQSTAAMRRVIVDTDPGVDDAAALIWLLSQPRYEVELLGIVTVAGNTNVDAAVNNASMILEWLETDTTVVRGASQPISQTPSLTTWFIHGPDGLWFTFPFDAPPATPDSIDATGFYCDQLEPGVLVIALGPLTNIAQAIEQSAVLCPGAWNGVEIVSVGGSRFQPSQTPVTEFNYWQDPEAAEKVLTSGPANGATVQIVLADAFYQFKFV